MIEEEQEQAASNPADRYRAVLAVARELADGDVHYRAMLCDRFLNRDGASPDDGTLNAVRVEFEAAAAKFETDGIFTSGRPVDEALRDLALGELDQALFIHLRPSSVSALVVESDAIGTLSVRAGDVADESWRILVPDLPSSAVEQAVALALGDARRGVTALAIDQTLAELLRRLEVVEFPKRTRVVLFRTLFGWRVYDIVHRQLVSYLGAPTVVEDCAPIEREGSLRDRLDGAIANAPLRFDYAFVTASIDPVNQAVRVETVPLFHRETSRLYGSIRDIQVGSPGTELEFAL